MLCRPHARRNLLGLALLVRFQRFMSFRTLVLHPLLITLTILVGTAVLALKTDIAGTTMAEYTLPSVFLMGACTASLQGGTLSLASMMSPTHIQVSAAPAATCWAAPATGRKAWSLHGQWPVQRAPGLITPYLYT